MTQKPGKHLRLVVAHAIGVSVADFGKDLNRQKWVGGLRPERIYLCISENCHAIVRGPGEYCWECSGDEGA